MHFNTLYAATAFLIEYFNPYSTIRPFLYIGNMPCYCETLRVCVVTFANNSRA